MYIFFSSKCNNVIQYSVNEIHNSFIDTCVLHDGKNYLANVFIQDINKLFQVQTKRYLFFHD